MNKKVVIAGVSVVGLCAIYFTGVYYSGKEANKFLQGSIEQAQMQTDGSGLVQMSAITGFYSSQYKLVYTPTELPEGAEEWMGGRDIPFNLDVKHGFLGAVSTLSLAESGLLTKLTSLQTNTDQPPLVLAIQQRFNPLSKQLSMQGILETDQFVIQSEQGSATIGAFLMNFEQHQRDFAFDFTMADSNVVAKDESLSIEGINGQESGRLDHDDPLQAVMLEEFDAVFTIDKIVLNTEEINGEVSGLYLGVQQQLNADRMITNIDYAADSVNFANAEQTMPTLTNPSVKLSFDLDYPATRELAIMLQTMPSDPNAMQQQMEGLLVMADSVSEKGMSAAINDLSVSWEGQKAYGNAALDVAPFRVSQIMAQPEQISQYLTLDAQLTLPVALLEMMPNYNPQQINAFIQMGFVQKQEDNYKVELSLKKGVLTLNGQPMPM